MASFEMHYRSEALRMQVNLNVIIPEGALDKAREAWEKNGYLGLGWNKEKMDDAYAKLKI